MASHYEAPIRNPLITGDKTYHDVTVDIARPVEGRANKTLVDSIFYCAFSFPLGIRLYDLYRICWDRYLGT